MKLPYRSVRIRNGVQKVGPEKMAAIVISWWPALVDCALLQGSMSFRIKKQTLSGGLASGYLPRDHYLLANLSGTLPD